jgi:hypothetical protein
MNFKTLNIKSVLHHGYTFSHFNLHPFGHAAILAIISISTFITVIILYVSTHPQIWYWTTWPDLIHESTLCDKVCQWLATVQWFTPGTLVSSTNETDRHEWYNWNIVESGRRARIAQVPVVVNPTTIWSWLQLNIFYQYHTLLFAWNSWKYYYSRIAEFFIFFIVF